MIESAGFVFAPPPAVVPNTARALELTELARDRDLHDVVHDRLMRAYWSESADIGDHATLVDLAAAAGLDRAEAEAALADRRYGERVQASTREAQRHGINAIPAFVLGGRLLVLGAQPEAVFEQAVGQLQEQPKGPAG